MMKQITLWTGAMMVLLGRIGSAWAGSTGIEDTGTQVPEPATLAILAAGVVALALAKSRARKR